MESFINPSKDELRFLTPFEVGDQKIHLYGSPVVMSYQSELIRGMLDKLDTKESNVLAPNMKVNESALLTLWSKMNGKPANWENNLSRIDAWSLLNYFDINVKEEIMKDYLDSLVDKFPPELTDHKYENVLADMLRKIKIISPMHSNSFLEMIEEQGNKALIIFHPDGRQSESRFNPIFNERTMEILDNVGYKLVTNDAGKSFYVADLRWYRGSSIYSKYYSYPTWNEKEDAYAMYPANEKGEKL